MGWKVGDRVRIAKSMPPPFRQPHPQHGGKLGTITDSTVWSFGFSSWFDVPVITLDDGTVLKGYECWWEPVKEEKEN